MPAKYLVNIGDERLYFDEHRQATERFNDEANELDGSLPIWPVDVESATSREWDDALATYTKDERSTAKIRLIGTERPPV